MTTWPLNYDLRVWQPKMPMLPLTFNWSRCNKLKTVIWRPIYIGFSECIVCKWSSMKEKGEKSKQERANRCRMCLINTRSTMKYIHANRRHSASEATISLWLRLSSCCLIAGRFGLRWVARSHHDRLSDRTTLHLTERVSILKFRDKMNSVYRYQAIILHKQKQLFKRNSAILNKFQHIFSPLCW